MAEDPVSTDSPSGSNVGYCFDVEVFADYVKASKEWVVEFDAAASSECESWCELY